MLAASICSSTVSQPMGARLARSTASVFRIPRRPSNFPITLDFSFLKLSHQLIVKIALVSRNLIYLVWCRYTTYATISIRLREAVDTISFKWKCGWQFQINRKSSCKSDEIPYRRSIAIQVCFFSIHKSQGQQMSSMMKIAIIGLY